MGTYSISDLSELTGVKTHTLRMWEKRYGFLRPKRTDTNIRFYADSDLELLRLVQRLNSHGVRISRIAEMSLQEMEEECGRISLRKDDFEHKLNQGLVNMDVAQLESVLDSAIRQHGFESVLVSLLIPFLESTQVMWLSGKIEEANETLFRELVKRKTNRELDMLPHNCSGPRIIMLLPHGNKQELQHLFMHYFLRKQGFCVTDMGNDIQIDCAESALKKCNAECVLIVNADPVHWQFSNYIKELAKRTHLPIVISGRAVEDHMADDTGQVIMLDNIEDTVQFVNRLQDNIRIHMS